MDIIENVNRLEDYLINESEISLIDIQKISTYLTNIREQAINYTRCCTELNHDFKIGDDVWITSKKLVTIADFCEDVERVQVEDGCDYYLVDKDELTKVV